MRIDVLGPIRAQADGTELDVGGAQQRLVLALLVEAGGRVVTTDQLIDRVWGDRLPDNARKTIQVHISKLRRALGNGDAIETIGGGYRLSSEIETDSQTFEQLLAGGRHHLQDRPEHAANLLDDALALWSGPAYADLRDEEALQTEIRRLEELRLGAMEDRLAARIAIGEIADAIAALEGLIEEHPVRERPRALLMTALYRAGRQTEALATYRTFSDRLAEESGLDPSPELRNLELAILNHDRALGVVASPPSRPPTASVLPVRYASFVGREQEIAEIAERMETHRLMTLVGPGGIGKSSLASEALRLNERDLGVRVVQVVVEGTGEADLAWLVVDALGLEPHGADPVQVIVDYTGDGSDILLFDGCEAVIDRAAQLADVLLTRCPSLRIVATSRQPLGLAGESVLSVEPLNEEDSLVLFADRSGLDLAGLDEFTIGHVAQLCEALDGLPLAIELAAARHGSIPLDSLVPRLGDQVQLLARVRSSGRHSSLVAAMDGSYQLLDSGHRRALRALSVFPFGFDLEAATDVVGTAEAPDIVALLTDVSLIQPADEHRTHRMLEPIRQYANHLLKAAHERSAIERLRAQGLARRCERAFIDLSSPRHRHATQWLVHNRLEIAAVLEWCIEAEEPDLATDIIAHAGTVIRGSGSGSLVLRTATAVIEHEKASPSATLAVAIAETARMVCDVEWESAHARALIARAEALASELGSQEALGRVLGHKACILSGELGPSHAEARPVGERGIALLRASGAEDWGHWLHNLALHSLRSGDLHQLEADIAELQKWEESTLGSTTGFSVGLLAELTQEQGNLDAAEALLRESALLHEQDQLWRHARWRWADAALAAAYAGRGDQARESWERADGLGASVGAAEENFLLYIRARVAAMLGDHTEALVVIRKWFHLINEGGGPSRFELYGRGNSPGRFLPILLSVATVWCEMGEPELACRFARAAPQLLAQADYTRWSEIGETARWQHIADRCGHEEGLATRHITIEQAFDEARTLL